MKTFFTKIRQSFVIIATFVIIGIQLSVLISAPTSFAQDKPVTPQNSYDFKATEIFSPSQYVGQSQGKKIDLIKNLPSGDWQTILTQIIKFILAITGTLALISFTYAGIIFLTGRGEEDQLSKAKKLLIWTIAALGIIAVSYAVVLGISQFKFFS